MDPETSAAIQNLPGLSCSGLFEELWVDLKDNSFQDLVKKYLYPNAKINDLTNPDGLMKMTTVSYPTGVNI